MLAQKQQQIDNPTFNIISLTSIYMVEKIIHLFYYVDVISNMCTSPKLQHPHKLYKHTKDDFICEEGI